jgi:hypothetical protein
MSYSRDTWFESVTVDHLILSEGFRDYNQSFKANVCMCASNFLPIKILKNTTGSYILSV